MIYFNSDSTSNGMSTIVATFDVGYSQDIGAVDIQNRVETAQAVLPPEVKQFGVTIKKTSTDMVCVVNLVSPDGRYDSTYLDNYAQIYVLDSLKRITGVSDVTVFGRKYAMRIWLDPDRLASQLIAPTEVIAAIQSENRQAAAGKIGGQPVPAGSGVQEYPILTKGRLTTVKEFEEIVVRRRDDGSIVRLGDVARIELDSENYDTAGWVNGKPAGTLPIYQYSDANGLDIVRQVRESMDHLAKSFPPGLEYHDQLRHDQVRQREHRGGRAHAARGVRAGPDRRFRVPPGRAGDDHPDAGDPGRAGRDLRADGGLRLLDQYADALRLDPGDRPGGRRRDHRRRERREVSRARRSRRCRPCARPWPRSRRRSSRSRWCWRRCSCRWRSSPA